MKYKLRAECLNDITCFNSMMEDKVSSFSICGNGYMMDMTFEFESEYSLEFIASILREIPDSHVMLETLQPIEKYTGERIV